jgi:DNA-binding beta-propeller fold protein YncE
MKTTLGKNTILVLFSLAILACASVCLAGENLQVSYLYKLSTFTGTAEVGSWPTIRVDDMNNEVYVVSPEEISVYQNGMQIYNITGESSDQAGSQQIFDTVVKKDGSIIFLTKPFRNGKSTFELINANFRGEPRSVLELKNLPSELADFQADRMLYRDGLLYLASMAKPRIVVVDEEGSYQRSYDVVAVLRADADLEAKKSRKARKDARMADMEVEWELGDVSLDQTGNILFTVPVLGSAYILTPELQLQRISKRGSGPGKFGIPSGIAADGKGNYFVSDLLKCVVMVFDRDLAFIDEFGGRNFGQASLIAPRSIVMDSKNRLYISQAEVMGVSVFQLTY